MKTCETCRCNRVCDHNKNGFENCGSYIPEWISVEDRLPEREGTYLVYTDKENITLDVFCIYPSHGTKFWVGGINGEVTHWMPLPEPPKMKGGA